MERPPFPNEVRLRIDAAEGLNVRTAPGVNEELVGTLTDGDIVTVTEDARSHCDSAGGCSARIDRDGPADLHFDETPWWLHVRSTSGLEGWVRSEYLSWPP